MQLLLPYYADSFETLQVFLSWSQFLYILSLFPGCELRHTMLSMSIYMGGTLCTQLLLQFYTVLFETLHVLMPWPEDKNVLRTKFSD